MGENRALTKEDRTKIGDLFNKKYGDDPLPDNGWGHVGYNNEMFLVREDGNGGHVIRKYEPEPLHLQTRS